MAGISRARPRFIGYVGLGLFVALMVLLLAIRAGGEWLPASVVVLATFVCVGAGTFGFVAWNARNIRRLEGLYPSSDFVKYVVVPQDRFTSHYLVADPNGLTLLRGQRWPLRRVWTVRWADIDRAESANLNWSDVAITKPGTALHLRAGRVLALNVPTGQQRGFGWAGAHAFTEFVTARLQDGPTEGRAPQGGVDG